jgi:hypothetical protein
MKPVSFLFAIFSLAIFSCTRQDSGCPSSATLKGSWMMIAVTDNQSGVVTTKPASVQGDVDITFSEVNDTSGTFYGNTPTNDISPSDYSTGPNQRLAIPFLDMTKVGETSWGYEFVDNIRSAQQYSFGDNSKLVIKTTAKTLTFKRQ